MTPAHSYPIYISFRGEQYKANVSNYGDYQLVWLFGDVFFKEFGGMLTVPKEGDIQTQKETSGVKDRLDLFRAVKNQLQW